MPVVRAAIPVIVGQPNSAQARICLQGTPPGRRPPARWQISDIRSATTREHCRGQALTELGLAVTAYSNISLGEIE